MELIMILGGGNRVRVKSIQTGSITVANATTNNTDTIDSVVLANSIIMPNGNTYGEADDPIYHGEFRIELTNETTVTAKRTGNTLECAVRYTVIEFYPGGIKSVQRGTITVNALTKDATITEVDTDKSALFHLGFEGREDPYQGGRSFCHLQLLNSTTVRATRGYNGATSPIVGYQVVEFF